MKIGILTHPLQSNYGGILQALALKGVLECLGHSVLILDRRHNLPRWKKWVKYVINILNGRTGRCAGQIDSRVTFINNLFKRTPEIFSHKRLVKEIRKNKIEAVIIGSDQVWNSGFCKLRDLDYWGGFLNECDVNVLSYAASMGIPEWTYDSKTTRKIVDLLKKFNGISVRETHIIPVLTEIGINNAQWVLDPTLLHDPEFYEQYITHRTGKSHEPYIFIIGWEMKALYRRFRKSIPVYR